jgi:antibiotic biosynthesis monooxygenase (ABM) superfamily enzyme
MVIHVVMIAFKPTVDEETIGEIRREIEALGELVPGLRNITTGRNFAHEDRAMDLVLIAHFDRREDLDFYATHPEHLKVIEALKPIMEYSKVVDFET